MDKNRIDQLRNMVKKKVTRDRDFMRITIKLKDKAYTASLYDDLNINKDDLDQEFIKQPSQYAWWAVLAELAATKRDRLKNYRDSVYAEKDKYYRKW